MNDPDCPSHEKNISEFVYYFLGIIYTVLTIVTLFRALPYLLKCGKKKEDTNADQAKDLDKDFKETLIEIDNFSHGNSQL